MSKIRGSKCGFNIGQGQLSQGHWERKCKNHFRATSLKLDQFTSKQSIQDDSDCIGLGRSQKFWPIEATLALRT